MAFKDKEKMLSYRRNYYREYYHKHKPSNIKSSGIKTGHYSFSIIRYYDMELTLFIGCAI